MKIFLGILSSSIRSRRPNQLILCPFVHFTIFSPLLISSSSRFVRLFHSPFSYLGPYIDQKNRDIKIFKFRIFSKYTDFRVCWYIFSVMLLRLWNVTEQTTSLSSCVLPEYGFSHHKPGFIFGVLRDKPLPFDGSAIAPGYVPR